MDVVEVFERFPTQDSCIDYIQKARWARGAFCPYCGSLHTSEFKNERRRHCNTCNTSFSVTVGTIFHKTRLPLQKWFLAVTLILNAKKGLSARRLARDLKVNKDTAWRISMSIRSAMAEREQRKLLTGLVEMNETDVGGKTRKGNPNDKGTCGRGTNKTPAVGMLERGGKMKA